MLKVATVLVLLAASAIALPIINEEAIDTRAINAAGCGKSKVALYEPDPLDRIVGGTNAKKGQYPWMISLVYYGIYHICGATIIDDYWVVTAAHCFSNGAQTRNYVVRAGAYDFSKFEAESKDYSVSKIINHPKWASSTLKNDITLIKVSTPFNFSSNYMNRVCLPSTSTYNVDNKAAKIVGWGDTKNVTGTNMPSVLQHADITIQSSTTCTNSWGSMYNHTMQVCAKSSTTAICSGDSGGPIMVADSTGAYVQVGISSFVSSSGCLTSYPVVFTRVSYYIDWIKSTIAAN